jgi:hypothetical protein
VGVGRARGRWGAIAGVLARYTRVLALAPGQPPAL